MKKCVKNCEIKVLRSNAGYYIGTLDEDGFPNCRLSEEYFNTPEEAKAALDTKSFTERIALENEFCRGEKIRCLL
jgi:hypothetical protein